MNTVMGKLMRARVWVHREVRVEGGLVEVEVGPDLEGQGGHSSQVRWWRRRWEVFLGKTQARQGKGYRPAESHGGLPHGHRAC